jgi:hypothetical protein
VAGGHSPFPARDDGVRLETISKLLGACVDGRHTERAYAQLLDKTLAREALAVWSA